jgi:Tfp pilus assembly protein PilN
VSAKLNLSSKPFRNRTLPWAIALVVCLISFVALSYVVNKSWTTSAQANKVEKEVEPLRKQKKTLEDLLKNVDAGLSHEQRQLLAAGHSLVNRKRFSWSYLFNELESVIPNNVKVSRIDVRDVFIRDGRMVADLEYAVISKSDAAVINMISEMNRTGVFQAELTGQDARKENNEAVTEWTMRVIYMQRVGMPTGQDTSSVAQTSNINGGTQ